MGSRSVGSVSINLGALKVGCKLYLTAAEEKVSFSSPVVSSKKKQIKKTPAVKIYKVNKNTQVEFTEEELTKLLPGNVNDINVCEFISNRFEHTHICKSYNLTPADGMNKHYNLLYQSLKGTKKAAVGKWITKGRVNLIAILPVKNNILMMHQLYYSNELKTLDGNIEKEEVSDAELDLMDTFIIGMSSDKFDLTKYSDTFSDNVGKEAARKIKERERFDSEITKALQQSIDNNNNKAVQS